MNRHLIDDISAATAECAMQSWLANWFPADRHAELREFLHDLTVGALTAFADVGEWRVSEPSRN